MREVVMEIVMTILSLLTSLVVVILVFIGAIAIVRFFYRKNKTVSSQKPSISPKDPLKNIEEKSKNMKDQNQHQKKWKDIALAQSPLIRLISIGFICLISVIVFSILDDVIKERRGYASYAEDRIAESWGSGQMVRGPALWVPYQRLSIINEVETNADGDKITKTKNVWKTHYRLFLPDELNITADLQTEERVSGIYPVPVYSSHITLSGLLPNLQFSDLPAERIRVNWSKAVFVVGVSDSVGLKQASSLQLGDNSKSDARSGLPRPAQSGEDKGFYYEIEVQNCATKECSFSLDVQLNGIKSINFSPTGKQTHIRMTSNWLHPSFAGKALPDEKDITDNGFKANWNISHLVRSYPQIADDVVGLSLFNEYVTTVNLYQPVNPYSMTIRAVKYGLLVVGLTLIGMFIFEQMINRHLHIAQYIVITVALCLFYLTLLSFSEHIGFLASWIVASIVIIGMVSTYTALALRSLSAMIGLSIFMGAVYTIMYALLRLEDYALLVGTVILLIMMGIVMVVTRKLNQPDKLEEK